MSSLPALPKALTACSEAQRIGPAVAAVVGAGSALLALRGASNVAEERGGQLKTAIDRAAEGWVLGMLQSQFPKDRFLAEEAFDADPRWDVGDSTYWTVDALDGTRSFMEGFDGFCVQVAYVVRGKPVIGVIHEPVRGCTYVAASGAGAFVLSPSQGPRVLSTRVVPAASALRFVDSLIPGGVVGAWFQRASAHFVECGSIGLKACRIVVNEGDVYAKAFRYRLWDVAPAQVLVDEVDCRLSDFSGNPLDYSGAQLSFESLLVVPAALRDIAVVELSAPQR